MRLIISRRVRTGNLELMNVESYAQEGHTLQVTFDDKTIRNYPLQHIEYYEEVAPASKVNVAPNGD